MKKIFSFFAAVMFVSTLFATPVVLDFNDNNWNLPSGSSASAAVVDTANYTDGVYTIEVGSPNDGFFYHTADAYKGLSLGKKDAHVTLPAFPFATAQIDIKVRSGQTANSKLNVFVGETEVSTAITGKGEDNNNVLTFKIDAANKAAGTIYTIKQLAAQYARIISITVYPVGEEPAEWVPDTLTVSEALALINTADELKDKAHFVKGVVVTQPYMYNGGAVTFLKDMVNDADTIEAYIIYKDENETKYASSEEIEFGVLDTVLIYGKKLSSYTTLAGVLLKEIDGGYYAKMLGAAKKMTMKFTAGTAEVNTIDGELNITFSNAAGKLTLPTIYYTQAETQQDPRALEATYDLAGAVFSQGGYNTPIVAGEAKVTFISADFTTKTKGVNSYRLQGSAIDGNNVVYNTDDTLVITGIDDESEEFFFTIDNNLDVRKVTCDRAVQIGQAMAAGETMKEPIMVFGYWARTATAYAYGVQSFALNMKEDATTGEFQAVSCYADSAVQRGDYVAVRGYLQNYKGTTIEIYAGKVIFFDVNNLPEIEGADPLDTISADHALEIGRAMENTTDGAVVRTPKKYVVIGYCVRVTSAYNETYKNESWTMSNDPNNSYASLSAYRLTPDAVVNVGDKVAVTAFITNTYAASTNKNTIRLEDGIAVHIDADIPDDVTAIPAVMMEESFQKSVKAIENGQIVVIKNGIKYNLLGTQID